MNRPRFSVRIAGSPTGSLLIGGFCIALIVDWYIGGAVPWWIALGSVGGLMRTFRAVRDMRVYNQWVADWQAMGTLDGEEPAEPAPSAAPIWRRDFSKVALFFSILLFLGIPFADIPRDSPSSTPMAVLWFGAGIYLAVRAVKDLIRIAGRKRRGRQAVRKQAVAEDLSVVAWMIERPGISPSRAEASAALPDYSRRLLTG